MALRGGGRCARLGWALRGRSSGPRDAGDTPQHRDLRDALRKTQSDDNSEYGGFRIIIEAQPQVPYATLVAAHFFRVVKWMFTIKLNFFSSTPYHHGKPSLGPPGEQLRRPAQAAHVASQELAGVVLAALHPWGGFRCPGSFEDNPDFPSCRFLESVPKKIIDKEINPFVDKWEEEGQFPAHKVFKILGQAGFLGVDKPTGDTKSPEE
ncbi:hypothetical protein DUI87_18183 [Hirundo rustica rustica]|uniref:Acyl-CoA dehydrogenase/oxidase N-terminal domain-containing protein n=1 Tax=Hirundo rustica rustica TaxID=333673 RepID=A0A3M0JVD5_HIRRU|nr:hypothetical protein DUI87_18183 [Hirundo rustica rustica]